MDLHRAFRHGARILAAANCEYSELHKGYGIDHHQWQLITSDEFWSPDQSRQIRSILANLVEVSLTISGMPPIPLPGHFVAAVIAEVVSPCNRLVACMKAPDTFDAFQASGIMGTFAVKPMPREQLLAIVMAYSGEYDGEPPNQRLDRNVVQVVKKEMSK